MVALMDVCLDDIASCYLLRVVPVLVGELLNSYPALPLLHMVAHLVYSVIIVIHIYIDELRAWGEQDRRRVMVSVSLVEKETGKLERSVVADQ